MKRFGTYILLVLLMLTFVIPGSSRSVNVNESDPIKVIINTEVKIKFGRKKKDCKGFGICLLVNISVSFRSINEFRTANGVAYFDEDTFTIEFIKESMTRETQFTFFNDKFKVEESFEIPRELLDKLKYTGDYTIETGDYIFEDQGDRLKVTF